MGVVNEKLSLLKNRLNNCLNNRERRKVKEEREFQYQIRDLISHGEPPLYLN